MLSSLTLRLDREEYSRFESARSVIRATVVPSPSTVEGSEEVTVRLLRGSVELASQALTFSGECELGLGASFDLASLADASGIPTATRGAYTVQVSQEGGPSASVACLVSFVTAEQMRTAYCQGANLLSSETIRPRRQPLLVTGVTICECSEMVRPGIYNLAFVVGDEAPNTLSFASGATVTLDDAVTEEFLPDTRGGYLRVEIDHRSLPEETVAEGILFDKERMTDDTIRDHIRQAVAEVENSLLHVFVEPQRIATEPWYSAPEPGEWFDRRGEPIAFMPEDFNARAIAWHLNLPVQQLQSIDRVEGWMGNSRVLEVASGAYAAVKKTGTVDILPYSSQYAYLYHFFTHMNFWGIREYVANFWRWKGVAGINEPPEAMGEIVKLIAFSAAITILTVAGQAYRGGFASESLSKDGVSQSRSYTASAMYGIYSATINSYKDWIKDNGRRIAQKYRGIPMVVL